MDIVYRQGEAGAGDVARLLPDKPSYNTVRVTLGILEKKGYLRHRQDGARYIYRPTIAADRARKSAMKHVISTFFQGSPGAAILALLDGSTAQLDRRELDEIAQAIEQARQKGDADA
jgi:predicted transcriptional regulator